MWLMWVYSHPLVFEPAFLIKYLPKLWIKFAKNLIKTLRKYFVIKKVCVYKLFN